MTPNIPAQPISLIISPQMAQQSLHRLIADQLGSDLALQVLEHGGVWLNHQRVTDTTITLTPGMHITLHTPPDGTYSTITIEARDICYEDPWLLVLNKQPLWYTNATPWDMQGHVLVALTQFLAERMVRHPTYGWPINSTEGHLVCCSVAKTRRSMHHSKQRLPVAASKNTTGGYAVENQNGIAGIVQPGTVACAVDAGAPTHSQRLANVSLAAAA